MPPATVRDWFALHKLRPTSEDSNQLSPVGLGSSPWLYIQSEALQDIAFHLPGGRMSEVPPSQKVTSSWILSRAALVGMLVQPETVPTAHQLTVPT
jgi:hypothetical protein